MATTVRIVGGWRDRAECRGADQELFIATGRDPDYPPDGAMLLCGRCDVRPECLAFALARIDVIGVWGGTSVYQRRQLRRRQGRVSCPACTSRLVVPTGDGEACLACGMSWAVRTAAVPPAGRSGAG